MVIYNPPRTKEEWWSNVDTCWDELKSMIVNYHPAITKVEWSNITAPNAEAARQEVVRTMPVPEDDWDPLKEAEECKERRLDDDGIKLSMILNQVWFGIPESTDCWNIPGFGQLCDLCSETWVFDQPT